jgi:diaminopimelate decarboxylase
MALVRSTYERRRGVLHVEGVPLDEVAAAHGTPCWVYSQAMILDAFHAYQRAFAGRPHRICYAVKANGNLAILEALARAGAGFDIVSGGELARVLAAGADPSRVVFSGVAKSTQEMFTALEHGIACFNVESEGELDRLASVAAAAGRTATIALRVNPDIDVDTHPYIATGLREHKFGIPIGAARALYRRAAGMPGIAVDGIACHVGSQLTSLDVFERAARALLSLAGELAQDGIAVSHLDLGGGLGLGDPQSPSPGIDAYVRRLIDTLDEAGDRGFEIVIEPGRSIVAAAGVLLTRVHYLKDNGTRHFAIVDAGMNDLIRPALYGAEQPVENVRGEGVDPIVCDVVGPVCESADFLARERRLAVAPGDLLAVGEAGAYGASMSSQYNARPRGAEVLVSGGTAHLVRERETIADLMRGEHLLHGSPGGPLSNRAGR